MAPTRATAERACFPEKKFNRYPFRLSTRYWHLLLSAPLLHGYGKRARYLYSHFSWPTPVAEVAAQSSAANDLAQVGRTVIAATHREALEIIDILCVAATPPATKGRIGTFILHRRQNGE